MARIVYHITTKNKALAILENGIMPGMPSSETGWDGQSDDECWPDETPVDAIAREIMDGYLSHGQYWFAWPSEGMARLVLRELLASRWQDYVLLAIDIGDIPATIASNTIAEDIFCICNNLASEGWDDSQPIDDCPEILDMVNELDQKVSQYKNVAREWNGETDLDGDMPEILIGQSVQASQIKIVEGI